MPVPISPARVEELITEARRQEAARSLPASASPALSSLEADLLEGLEAAGFSSYAGRVALVRYTKLVQVEQLRKLAAETRAAWEPQPCPWVGALDEEIARLLKELA